MKTNIFWENFECERFDPSVEVNLFKKPVLLGNQQDIQVMLDNLIKFDFTNEDTQKVYPCVNSIKKVRNYYLYQNTLIQEPSYFFKGGVCYPIEKAYYVHNVFRGNYYHFLIEELPIIIKITQYDKSNMIFCTCTPKYAESLLRQCSFSNLYIDYKPESIYKCKELFIPNPPVSGCPVKSDIQNMISVLKQKIPFLPQDNTAILLFRKEKERKILNFDSLLESLKKEFSQFNWVVFDSLDMNETIHLFNKAKVVVAPHGAGLSNMVFCEKGTLIYELMPISDPNPCYHHLAEVCEHKHHIYAVKDSGIPNFKQMEVDVEKIISEMKKDL